jgi:hypothetical protein
MTSVLTQGRRCRKRQLHTTSATADPSEQSASLPDPQPVTGSDGQPAQLPNAPGIYAVYDAEGTLQYVGMSRKVLSTAAGTSLCL